MEILFQLLFYHGVFNTNEDVFVQSSKVTAEKTMAQRDRGTCPAKVTKLACEVEMGSRLELCSLTLHPRLFLGNQLPF